MSNSTFSLQKRIFFVATIVIFTLVISLIENVKAETTNPFAGGTGKEDNPYQIETADQLNKVRDDLTAHYKLTANIDLATYGNWNPIGDYDNEFTGTFDGSGFTISNLNIDKEDKDYVGLFGSIGQNSKIKNVTIENASVKGESSVGILVGMNKGTIENSRATGNVTGYYNYVGGLAGYNYQGTIENSRATGNITGSYFVGGLAGYNYQGTIENSYATGNVTGEYYVGGLVGTNSVSGSIQNSFALNSKIIGDSYFGRIVGYYGGTLNNNYALSDMLINGNPITNSNANDNNGADINETWAKTIFPYLDRDWDFTIWQIEAGEYPTLRDTQVTEVVPTKPTINTNKGTIVEKNDVFTLNLCGDETEATISTVVEGNTKFFRWMDENGETQSLDTDYNVLVGKKYQLEVVSGTGNRQTYDIEVKSGFDLTLQENNPLGGSISGTPGCYSEGQEVELEAKPNPGYRFVKWTIDDEVKSTESTYTYTMETEAVTLIAHFEKESYDVTVKANDAKGGTVTGGGTYEYEKEVELKATPNAGYRFVNWTVDGDEVSTEPTFTYTIPAKNVTIEAHFEKQSYDITVKANVEKGGTVTGGGTYEYEKEVELTATPKKGYRFVNWTIDGKEVSKDPKYTYKVQAKAVTIIAHFEKESYDITVKANDEKGGTVTGGGKFLFESGVTLTATPNAGYRFVNWTVDGDEVSTESTFTYKISAKNVTLIAHFEKESYNVTVKVNDAKGGTVTGGGKYLFESGVTLTATPNAGYRFVKWTIDGKEVSKETTLTYTVQPKDIEIVANFEKLSYKVTVKSNHPEGGSISGEGTYQYGENITLTATPKIGYRFVSWTINGKKVSVEPTFTYTVSAEDAEIIANFEILSFKVIVHSNDSKAGKVTGNGTYEYGSEVILKAAPNEGYRFVNWTINGKEVSDETSFIYTVPAEDVTITANFEEIRPSIEKPGSGPAEEIQNEPNEESSILPKTAMHYMNWLLIGLAFILIGAFGYILNRKRNTQ